MKKNTRRYTLSISCPDRVGIVAAVTSFIAARQGWISEASQHSDSVSNLFFMRQEILADSLAVGLDEFRHEFAVLGREYHMDWTISDSAHKKKVVILVSKQEHCLYDLLARWQSRELDIDIPCVISNHETFRDLVEWHGIRFEHVPVTPENKEQAYARVMDIIDGTGCDVIVLARYMQILSREMCERYAGKIINIHHSFLPSFIGAKPYHQAHERGVKLVGATCHYVTADLDEGPIIEQDLTRVDHSDEADDLVKYGKDIEKTVLARGLRYHLEARVLRLGNKTVVFR